MSEYATAITCPKCGKQTPTEIWCLLPENASVICNECLASTTTAATKTNNADV